MRFGRLGQFRAVAFLTAAVALSCAAYHCSLVYRRGPNLLSIMCAIGLSSVAWEYVYSIWSTRALAGESPVDQIEALRRVRLSLLPLWAVASVSLLAGALIERHVG